uniref:Uncharacterized protein n=1 Tax=Anguilla anguilla TaxID=7936 RepID=A0A0E9XWG8_ANGAN
MSYIDYICVRHLSDSLSFEAKESQETAEPTAAVFAKRPWDPGKVILTLPSFRISLQRHDGGGLSG